MGRGRYYYVGHYDDNSQSATTFGPKRIVEAMATLISSPSFGAGRKVCVYRYTRHMGGYDPGTKKFMSCWTKGSKERSKRRR